MKTKFVKFSSFDSAFPPKWAPLFNAGDAWLQSLQVLQNNQEEIYLGIVYVLPWIVSFCIELYVKSIAAYEDKTLNVKGKYNHGTSQILRDYASKVPIFLKILSNEKLLALIEEYEKTKDTKFGETYSSIDGVEQKILIDLVYQLRSEITKRTGLR